MTTSNIKRFDDRLLLFQTLALGCETGQIRKPDLEKIEQFGADMSVVFAKKYYTVVETGHLIQASQCVLGILNLGLVQKIGKSQEKALQFLLKTGMLGTFQEGWTLISRLVEKAQKAEKDLFRTTFEWEKEMAESVSAAPGRNWHGDIEYCTKMLMYTGAGRRQSEK